MGTIKFAVAPATACLAKFPIPRLASRTTQKCQIWYQFSIIIPAQSYLIAEDIKILVFDSVRPPSVTAVLRGHISSLITGYYGQLAIGL
jgi:hypothetical protein